MSEIEVNGEMVPHYPAPDAIFKGTAVKTNPQGQEEDVPLCFGTFLFLIRGMTQEQYISEFPGTFKSWSPTGADVNADQSTNSPAKLNTDNDGTQSVSVSLVGALKAFNPEGRTQAPFYVSGSTDKRCVGTNNQLGFRQEMTLTLTYSATLEPVSNPTAAPTTDSPTPLPTATPTHTPTHVPTPLPTTGACMHNGKAMPDDKIVKHSNR